MAMSRCSSEGGDMEAENRMPDEARTDPARWRRWGPSTSQSGDAGKARLVAVQPDMRDLPRYPSLYQINTRVWLTELTRGRRRRATLDDIPDGELDRVAEMGFDWVWLLSVWGTGPTGQLVSRTQPDWRREFEHTLSDLREEDIAGSGFAITGYTVPP